LLTLTQPQQQQQQQQQQQENKDKETKETATQTTAEEVEVTFVLSQTLVSQEALRAIGFYIVPYNTQKYHGKKIKQLYKAEVLHSTPFAIVLENTAHVKLKIPVSALTQQQPQQQNEENGNSNSNSNNSLRSFQVAVLPFAFKPNEEAEFTLRVFSSQYQLQLSKIVE
jgi:hypothetical protein